MSLVNIVRKKQFYKGIVGKYNSIVKLHGKKTGRHNMKVLYPNLCTTTCAKKRQH